MDELTYRRPPVSFHAGIEARIVVGRSFRNANPIEVVAPTLAI